MGTLYCWTENDTLCSDPHWGSQVDKIPCQEEAVGMGQQMPSWFLELLVIDRVAAEKQ